MAGLLRRHSWIVPVVFAALLAAVGWTSYRALERSMKAEIASRLETVRNATATALEIWAAESRAVVEVHAARREIRDQTLALLEIARRSGGAREALLAAPAGRNLREELARVVESHGFAGWAVVDQSGLFLGAGSDRSIGRRVPDMLPAIGRMIEGQTLVTPPLALAYAGENQVVQMLIGGPVRDESGRVIAAFGFAIDPEEVFGRILVVGRAGESGETYAFDHDGVLVSPSRFDDQLRAIGVLPDDPSVGSFMHVDVRDPGGDLTAGFEPTEPVKARPLTRAAASALAGDSGVDIEGYRDYRGVLVAGAWTWLPGLGVGITSEVDIDEAYAGLTVLRRRFGIVVGALVLGALGMFLYSFVVMRLRREVDEARQIGRYRIERKLGSGGMGTVYLARHALLRRPTAIKILSPDKAGKEGIARFEREVQVSSALTHPNTIEIYDYGHTPDGTFYYAMEYVNGITLSTCVSGDGPQPEARVVYLMKQICASIAESHARGLMHRDLKPSNVMVCERGGAVDFVKVLDFGLAKELTSSSNVNLTDVASLTGTPLYMPPEAAQAPETLDVRGDVYQLGLVAFYLLVGRNLFSGDTPVDVIVQHVGTPPTPPTEALGRPVSPDLEQLILRSLEKKPENRFAHAGEMLEALERCVYDGTWGQPEARTWWASWRERYPLSEEDGQTASSFPSGYDIELGERLKGG